MEGARFWAYDRSFTSRSYCCLPGGGYFVNDTAQELFDKYAIFYNFRNEVPGRVLKLKIFINFVGPLLVDFA